jgi:hypothetical protein
MKLSSKVVKEIFKVMCLTAALSSSALAEFRLVQDLKGPAEGAVISYMKDDPKCHSCRGNARSAGVEYLEWVYDNVAFQNYLRGSVWSNSCQDMGGGMSAYGSLNASLNPCGYTNVQFLLPIQNVEGQWVADYAGIVQDIGMPNAVPKVTPATLTPEAGNFIQMFSVMAVKGDPNYPALQIDIEEIFKISAPYLL